MDRAKEYEFEITNIVEIIYNTNIYFAYISLDEFIQQELYLDAFLLKEAMTIFFKQIDSDFTDTNTTEENINLISQLFCINSYDHIRYDLESNYFINALDYVLSNKGYNGENLDENIIQKVLKVIEDYNLYCAIMCLYALSEDDNIYYVEFDYLSEAIDYYCEKNKIVNPLNSDDFTDITIEDIHEQAYGNSEFDSHKSDIENLTYELLGVFGNKTKIKNNY